jgi:hypothetical protein
MLTKIMEWVSITALLVVLLCSSASYQLLLEIVVCAGAVLVVLASFSIKNRVETHYVAENRSNPARRAIIRL